MGVFARLFVKEGRRDIGYTGTAVQRSYSSSEPQLSYLKADKI